MRKNSGLILKFCLIFNLNFCFIFSESDFNQDSINTANLDDMSNPVLNYPGKPLLMSLFLSSKFLLIFGIIIIENC